MTKKRSSNFTSTKSRNKLRNFRRMPTIVTAIDEGMTRQQLGKILSKTDANFAKSIEASYYYEAKKCEVCNKDDNQQKLILCDRCDDAYHTQCLDPPLSSVPEKQWMCEICDRQILEDQIQEKFKPSKYQKCAKCDQNIWTTLKIIKRNKIQKSIKKQPNVENQRLQNLKNKRTKIKNESSPISSSQYRSQDIIVHWSNKGIMCKCCKIWFHKDFCLNIRCNAVNCENCEKNIRSNGPKGHQQFLKYIEDCYEEAMTKNDVLGTNDIILENTNNDMYRSKFIGLKLPPSMTDWLQIVQQQMTLHYALKTEGMNFIDGQVYNPKELPIAANNAQGQKIINPLAAKDQLIFVQFKRKSIWGFCAPIEIMQDRKVGFYARAILFIPEHTILYQYAGQVIPCRKSLNQNNDSIMSLLRTPRSSTSFDICPMKYGNGSKFVSGINNKDKMWRFIQNVKTLRFLFNGKIRLLFYAKRDIKAGQTLYINYNAGAFQEYPTEHFVH